MRYKKRRTYKYNLHSSESYHTGLTKHPGSSGMVSIGPNGMLLISEGYAWDGPSGPTIDTETFMRGSLIHDALYQLLRKGLLPQSSRKKADQILRDVCIEDGMSKIRAWWVYQGVRLGGASSAKPDMLECGK